MREEMPKNEEISYPEGKPSFYKVPGVEYGYADADSQSTFITTSDLEGTLKSFSEEERSVKEYNNLVKVLNVRELEDGVYSIFYRCDSDMSFVPSAEEIKKQLKKAKELGAE